MAKPLLLLVICLLPLAGCQTTTTGGTVGMQRSQLMLIPSQQLEKMSAQSYAKLTAEASKKGTLNEDHALLLRLRAVADHRPPQFRRPSAHAIDTEEHVKHRARGGKNPDQDKPQRCGARVAFVDDRMA